MNNKSILLEFLGNLVIFVIGLFSVIFDGATLVQAATAMSLLKISFILNDRL